MKPFVTGVRHLKVWVSDLARSRHWYEEVLDLEHVSSFEDGDGVIRGMAFRVPGLDIAHSPIVEGSRGYVLGFRDPDGLQIRLNAEDAEVAARAGDVVTDRPRDDRQKPAGS